MLFILQVEWKVINTYTGLDFDTRTYIHVHQYKLITLNKHQVERASFWITADDLFCKMWILTSFWAWSVLVMMVGADGVDLSGCGSTKGCYRQPEDCTNCDYVITWSSTGDNQMDMEIQGTVSDQASYVALGLSLDQTMEDDSVMDCIGNVGVQMSYNSRHDNAALDNPSTGIVVGSEQVNYTDGTLVCRFSRYISLPTRRRRNTDADKVFDLNAEYYLFVAKGPVSSGRKSYHTDKITYGTKINIVTTATNIGGTTGYPLVKAHGILMILAWMVSASVAVLMPRYCKAAWPGKTCGGKQIWFQIHMPLMVSTLLLTVIGFIIIFVSVGGYAQYPDYPERLHPPFGIITTILVIANPIMAAFRPSPKSPKRPIFNICHFVVGLMAQICAVVSIFLALYMGKVGAPDWTIWVMVVYVLWHTAIEVCLALHMRCAKTPDPDDPAQAVNGTKSGRSLAETTLVSIHFIGVLVLSLALIIAIAGA